MAVRDRACSPAPLGGQLRRSLPGLVHQRVDGHSDRDQLLDRHGVVALHRPEKRHLAAAQPFSARQREVAPPPMVVIYRAGTLTWNRAEDMMSRGPCSAVLLPAETVASTRGGGRAGAGAGARRSAGGGVAGTCGTAGPGTWSTIRAAGRPAAAVEVARSHVHPTPTAGELPGSPAAVRCPANCVATGEPRRAAPYRPRSFCRPRAASELRLRLRSAWSRVEPGSRCWAARCVLGVLRAGKAGGGQRRRR